MQSKSSITPQLLVVGETVNHLESALAALHLLKTWSNLTLPNADVLVLNEDGEGITIEAVRDVIQNSSYPPYQTAERAVLPLQLEQASAPAQQALLKLLEEPPNYLRIVATTSQPNAILSTIHSRCQVVNIKGETVVEISEEVQAIYQQIPSMTPKEVIKVSETYKDLASAQDLLRQLIQLTHRDDQFPTPQLTTQLKSLSHHLERLGQNANVRLTLEHCFFQLNPNLT